MSNLPSIFLVDNYVFEVNQQVNQKTRQRHRNDLQPTKNPIPASVQRSTLTDLVCHSNREARDLPPTAQRTVLADLLVWELLGDTRTVLHQE